MGKAAPWLHDLSQGKVSFSLCFSFKITLEGTRWVSRLRICSGHGPGAGVWLEPASSSVPPSPAHHSCSLSLFFSNKGCILKKNKIPLRAAPPPHATPLHSALSCPESLNHRPGRACHHHTEIPAGQVSTGAVLACGHKIRLHTLLPDTFQAG